MLFKNILVPFDLSSPSHHAFKVALDMAQKYDSKITLITCIEGDAWHHKFYDARADTELLKKQSKVAKKYMEKLEAPANKAGVSIKLQILKSTSVVKDIITFAKSNGSNCYEFSW
jgi:nucleotide-binding universal stress UspA family protein